MTLSAKSPLRLGYLVSRYPAISHSFILREILELRACGLEIEVASINLPERELKVLTLAEKAEADRTFYVKRAGSWGAISAQAWLLLRNPVRLMRGLLFALQLAGADLRRVVLHCLYFVEAVMLAKWMRQKNLTHLHVHFATPAATVATILTQVTPVGMSITVHGPDEFYDVPGYRLLEKICRARFVCVIGAFARSQLMKIAPVSEWSKFEMTPLGVDTSLYQPQPRVCAESFEVLCVGRLVPAKGQHILLSAVAKLISSGRNILLRFVGDGPDRPSLEKEANRLGIMRCVRFEGALNQDETRQCYQTADIFALASFAEGIPVVLMEAMAMEIPCVTTWINGVPELIRSEIDGLLVPPSDADALAAAIARLMNDSELRERLGKAGRVRVQERYDLSRNVAALAKIFDRHLGAAQAAGRGPKTEKEPSGESVVRVSSIEAAA